MNEQTSRNPLEKFLRLFTDIRGGEGATALLLTVNIFLLMTAYYIIKPIREALILSGSGAEVKIYTAAGQTLLLLIIVPLYARLASAVPRRKLITIMTVIFSACLLVFYLAAQLAPTGDDGGSQPWLGIVFYLWVGIFNLMVVAQFWSFANDVYTPEEGKRLFAIVAFGQSGGAWFGSFIMDRLVGPVGLFQLMLLSAVVLFVSLSLTWIVDGRERRRARRRAEEREVVAGSESTDAGESGEKPLARSNPFGMVFRTRYLLLIGLLILFLNWVNTTGEYILGKTVEGAAAAAVAEGTTGGLSEGEYIGKFYANFYWVVNLVGAAIQLLLVSRIFKYFGLRVAIMVLPLIALGGYALLAFYPLLAVVRWAKTAENATDYSLQNTVRQTLFLPTTREQKYVAKQAIDTFFWRTGDVLAAACVFVGTTWLGLGIKGFALFNLLLVAVWIVLAYVIGRENQRLVSSGSLPARKE